MKKDLSGWQRVLLHVLKNDPKAKGGRDAWERLTDEEKSAVTDFLAEHCGGDVQAALEETFPLVKRRKWPRWAEVLLGAAIWFAAYLGWSRIFKLVPELVKPWFVSAVWIWVIVGLFGDDRDAQMRQLWHERADNLQGRRSVLEQMHNVAQLTSWQAKDKAGLAFRGVVIIIIIAMTFLLWYDL